ncbi:MAG: molybdate ABC transporter substrate-binding protein [Syntrophomonadaceae bacterium]
MKKIVHLAMVITLILSLAVIGGCAKTAEQAAAPSSSQSPPSLAGQTLNLYVAAGLKKPMDQVIELFQKETGASVVVNYNSSGALWAQINQGQPCDLYYSADWIYIEKAQQAGKVEKDLKFLNDKIVLAVSATGASKVSSINDLVKPGVTYVIADASAPAGVYAKNALVNLQLWDKTASNLKAMPSTVNQVAIMVKEDQVDAGLLYSSVANGNQLKTVEVIDPKFTGEIIFGAAMMKGEKTQLAQAFMDFASKNVKSFEQYGWTKYE